MELIALNCNNCGSKLKVADSAKFVTCKHCDTQLAIHHNDGASFTELAEAASRVEESAKQIEEHAGALSEQNRVIVLQNDLERLDREWATERDAMMIKGKNGHQHAPTRAQAYLAYCSSPVILCLGVFGYSMTSSIAMLIACVFAVFFFFIGSSTLAKAKVFEDAQAQHETARAALERDLDAASARAKSSKGKSQQRKAKSDADD